MKALVYNGRKDVSVKNVPDAKIEHPADVLVKIACTNICGSSRFVQKILRRRRACLSVCDQQRQSHLEFFK